MSDTWQTRFDRLLKAMASGEPPKRKGGVALPAETVRPPSVDCDDPDPLQSEPQKR